MNLKNFTHHTCNLQLIIKQNCYFDTDHIKIGNYSDQIKPMNLLFHKHYENHSDFFYL